MREGMEFPGEEEMLKGYSNAFGVLRGNDNFTLETANKLFVQEGYKLVEEFVKVMEDKFFAEATQTDFAASEVARKIINDWWRSLLRLWRTSFLLRLLRSILLLVKLPG